MDNNWLTILITVYSLLLHLEVVLFLGLSAIMFPWRMLKGGQWGRQMLSLTAVKVGYVPLTSLCQVCIVMLILWLQMNLDHRILLPLESVSSVQ